MPLGEDCCLEDLLRPRAQDRGSATEYLVGTLAQSYKAFEAKIAAARSTEGLTKQQITLRHIRSLPLGRTFKVRDLRAALPGISDPTFRIALNELKASGEVKVEGTGPGAVWTRTEP